VKLEPKDQLSVSFAKALTTAKDSTTTPATATGPAPAGAPAAAAAPAPSTPAAAATPATTPGTAASPTSTSETEPAEAPQPPPPPSELTGTWKAAPSPDTAITLALQADGAYRWEVVNKGQKQETSSGRAVYVNIVLSLTQEEGPPLAGRIESRDSSKFIFHLMGGGNNASALAFSR